MRAMAVTSQPKGSDRERFRVAIESLWNVGIVALGPINDGVERAHAALGDYVERRFPGGMGSYLFWTGESARAFRRDGSLADAITLHCSSDEVASTAVALLQDHGVDAAAPPEPATVIVFPSALAREGR